MNEVTKKMRGTMFVDDELHEYSMGYNLLTTLKLFQAQKVRLDEQWELWKLLESKRNSIDDAIMIEMEQYVIELQILSSIIIKLVPLHEQLFRDCDWFVDQPPELLTCIDNDADVSAQPLVQHILLLKRLRKKLEGHRRSDSVDPVFVSQSNAQYLLVYLFHRLKASESVLMRIEMLNVVDGLIFFSFKLSSSLFLTEFYPSLENVCKQSKVSGDKLLVEVFSVLEEQNELTFIEWLHSTSMVDSGVFLQLQPFVVAYKEDREALHQMFMIVANSWEKQYHRAVDLEVQSSCTLVINPFENESLMQLLHH